MTTLICIRRPILLFLVLALGSVSVPTTVRAGDRPKKPHIVVFLADDQSQRDATPYGAKDVRTPNLERLARAGAVFTHAFVASPSCAPSRAALLTGLMPARNGAEANHAAPRDEIKKLPAYLQELGYLVAAFGKVAHYNMAHRYGFDHADNKHDTPTVARYLAGRDKTKPLCLFVGTNWPHVPWPANRGYDPAKLNLPPDHVDTPLTRKYRAEYYTAVTEADREMGEIYDLVRNELGEDVLFIYTSDHGGQWPFGKWNLYDAGIRVPFIAAWPGRLPPGSRSDAMISWIDLLPTFVELAGGTPPRDIDGRSFAGVLLGKAKTHRDEIFTTHTNDGRMNVYPIRSLRTRDFHYILNPHPDWAHTTHIDMAQPRDGLGYWKSWEAAAKPARAAAALVRRYHQRPKEELYDLCSDPDELKNLAADPAHADRLKQMRDRLTAWMREQGDTVRVTVEPRPLADPESWRGPVAQPAPKKGKRGQ